MKDKEQWKMNSKKRFLSLRTKLAIGFSLLAIIALGLTSYIYYQNIKATLFQDIRVRLRDAVSIGALQVDALAHSELTNPSQEGQPTYMELKKTLQKIRDAGTDITYVYTMRQDAQGNIIFIVDAEETEENVSHLGDIYDDASSWLIEIFPSIQKPVVEPQFYSDKWGTWLTGYAPVYTQDGHRDAVLGMDIAADDVIAQQRQALQRSLLIFLGSIPLVALGGWSLGSLLTMPISKLTRGAEYLADGDFSHPVDINTNDEIGFLGQIFNATSDRLKELVGNLEQRVDERTAELARRTSQLQAATRVAGKAAAIKDTPTLMNDAVNLISDQFGFYHAGIFLLDENNEYAVLHAASSEGGKRMLTRGHRLQVGKKGIVGFVAAQKRPRIALDTGSDAVFFDNPDLPDTRSEASLPLIARGRVIGVLDIQSEKPKAFSSEDIETFQTLADQLALAIDNSHLLEETNLVVQQLEQSVSQRAQGAWRDIIQTQNHAYQYTPLGIRPATTEYLPTTDADRLKIPITLHNQKIGEIKVKRKEGTESWDPREETMLVEIASQVALALENARLFSEAQQRVSRERSIGEITARIGTAHDVDAILRVTAQEIGKAIGDSEIAVHIREQDLEGE
jgi:GAF domain-containing protein/HAMP domain-containing protein